jgi:hypothetical protein
MNPTTAFSMIMSFVSMGSGMVMQGVNIHRELHPPNQQAMVQPQCPIGQQPTLMTTTTGQRVWICVPESK